MKALFLQVFFLRQTQFLTHNSTVLRLGTLSFQWMFEVSTKYTLSHNDRIVVLEMRLHSDFPILYRAALHGN